MGSKGEADVILGFREQGRQMMVPLKESNMPEEKQINSTQEL